MKIELNENATIAAIFVCWMVVMVAVACFAINKPQADAPKQSATTIQGEVVQ